MVVPFIRPAPTAKERADRKVQRTADLTTVRAAVAADREQRRGIAREELQAMGDPRILDPAAYRAAKRLSLKTLRSGGW